MATLPDSQTRLHRYTAPSCTLAKSLRYLSLGGVPYCDFDLSSASLCASLDRIKVDSKGVVAYLSVILHLGQLTFCLAPPGATGDEDLEDRFQVEDSTVLSDIEKLCGVKKLAVEAALTTRVMTTRGETFVMANKKEQCVTIRDAVARQMYGRLFDYLVGKINESIGGRNGGGGGGDNKTRTEINVLDIFGFESFKTNTFEQLCINYTNECLQEQFNKHVFEQQQQEYIREGIKYEEVKFKSNQYIIDVIQGNTGILGQLNDECKLPEGEDGKWARKMYQVREREGEAEAERRRLTKQMQVKCRSFFHNLSSSF